MEKNEAQNRRPNHRPQKSERELFFAEQFRQAIKQRMNELGLNAAQVAIRANMSPNTVYSYLLEHNDLSTGKALMILTSLNASVRIIRK